MTTSTIRSLLCAFVVLSALGTHCLAQAQTGCFQPVQHLLTVRCVAPAQIGEVLPNLAFAPRLPSSHALPGPRTRPLTRVITLTTESAVGGKGMTYALFLVYGTITQGRQGALVPSARQTHYLVIAEILEHSSTTALIVGRGNGALGVFRTRASRHAPPWTAQAALPGANVDLSVTTNLSRAAAVHMVKALIAPRG